MVYIRRVSNVNAGTIHSLKTIKIRVRHFLLNRFSYKEKPLA